MKTSRRFDIWGLCNRYIRIVCVRISNSNSVVANLKGHHHFYQSDPEAVLSISLLFKVAIFQGFPHQLFFLQLLSSPIQWQVYMVVLIYGFKTQSFIFLVLSY